MNAVCSLILELGRLTGFRGAVLMRALARAGYPEGELPSATEANAITSALAEPEWVTVGEGRRSTRTLIAHYVPIVDQAGLTSGVGLLWDPRTRLLHGRLRRPTRNRSLPIDAFVNDFLLNGARRFARIWEISDEARRGRVVQSYAENGERSEARPLNADFFPEQIFWLDCGVGDFSPEDIDLAAWLRPPILAGECQSGNPRLNTIQVNQLPHKGDAFRFIEDLVDGHNKPLPEWTLARSGERVRGLPPQPSVESRLALRGRRAGAELRTIRFGVAKNVPAPTLFEAFSRGEID